jgi:hypothetical protein
MLLFCNSGYYCNYAENTFSYLTIRISIPSTSTHTHVYKGVDIGFAPILFDPPTQGPIFEQFAYSVYAKLGWPNTTAQSPNFGRGIWAEREDDNGNLQRYHDQTGVTPYPSNYTILTPIFRTDDGPT